MLEFEEALGRILGTAAPLGAERVGLSDALGRVLAAELCSPGDLPPYDYSAMDGYAVASGDFGGVGPWTLAVRGESQTGHPTPEFSRGTACRIFTGARLPAGADAVVMQEDVERRESVVSFQSAPTPGSHVRRRGEDLAEGAVALAAGTRLGPFQLGLAAAADQPSLLVARRPRVTVLCTGDELREVGSPARPGSIPDSNGVALAALARAAGAEVTLGPLVPDERAVAERLFASALAGSDVVVTVGGVSVGEHDVVRAALEALGVNLDFWKVNIKPGKPLAFGTRGATRVLGIPGNPVSAQLTFSLFGVPLLRRLQGDPRPRPSYRQATLTHALKQKPGRLTFLRARLDADRVTAAPSQASGAAMGLAWADALIVVPASSTGFAAGDTVSVLRLAEL